MIKRRIRSLEALVESLAAILSGRTPPPSKRLQTVAKTVMDLIQEQVEAVRAEPSGGGGLEKGAADHRPVGGRRPQDHRDGRAGCPPLNTGGGPESA